MAPPRKRSTTSGFSSPKEENKEVAEELTSSEEKVEEEATQATVEEIAAPEPEPEPVIPEITPIEDTGPRFLEQTILPQTPAKKVSTVPASTGVKRHPRNIPKFSRFE